MSLIANQKNVVASESNTSCLALPGSGKSFTSVKYISRVVNDHPNSNIVAISFTRKAALELKEKLINELGHETLTSNVKVSTFDSLFYQQLKQSLNGKQISLISNAERRNIVSMAIKKQIALAEMRASRSKSNKPSKRPMTVDDALPLFDLFSSYIEFPDDVVKENKDAYELYKHYVAIRSKKKLWEHSSISVAVVNGIESGLIPLMDISHLVVDEFQDTSDIQYRWIQQYKNTQTKVLVVGDDDQAIYSFRHSNGYQNFVQFEEDFKPDRFVLNICFRCRPTILKKAQTLIEHNKARVAKDMRSIFTEGGDVHLIPYTLDLSTNGKTTELLPTNDSSDIKPAYEHHDQVISKVLDLIQHESAGEWAVLARTNNELWGIRTVMTEKGIPIEDEDFKSIFNAPIYLMIDKLFQTFINKNKSHIEDLLLWVGADYHTIFESNESGLLSPRQSLVNATSNNDHERCLIKLIQAWSEDNLTTDSGVSIFKDFLRNNFSQNKNTQGTQGYLTKSDVLSIKIILKILLNLGHSNFREAVMRLMKFERDCKNPKNEIGDKEPTNTVKLLTLHSSKGLEFNNVIIYNASKGSIPSSQCSTELEIEEERRLFFVGMTRAKDTLIITYDGQNPSEFIDELN